MSDIPDGFKDTEIGVIPDEWEVTRMDTISNVMRGSSPRPKGNPEYFSSSPTETHWIMISDLTKYKKGKFITNTDEYLTEAGKKKSRYLTKGSLVLTNSGTVGIPAILGIDGCIHDGYLVFLDIDDSVHVDYMYYWFSSIRRYLEKIAPRGTQANLNTTIAKNLKIPLPPLPEQRAIAAILSAVQDAKEKTEGVIQTTRELKRSLMKYLFTYGPVPIGEAEDVPLKETEIGMVPEEWEVLQLGDVASRDRYSFVDGPFGSNLKRVHYTDSGVLVIQSGYFTRGQFKIVEPCYTSVSKADELFRSNVRRGDIVIAKIGMNFGACDIVPEWIDRAVLSGNTMKLTVNNEVASSIFIKYYLNFFKETGLIKEVLSTRTAQPALSLSGMKKVTLPLPALPIQHQIANILTAVDSRLEAEENRKQALEELFKTLLHNLMTGKIRVNNMEMEL